MSTTTARRARRGRRIAATALALTALLGVAACSDDDAAAGTSTTTTAAEPGGDDGGGAPGGPGEGAAPIEDECDAYAALSAAMTGDPSAAGPILDEFESHLPEELAEPGTAMVAGFRKMFEGDEAAMGSPEFTEGYAAVGDALFDSCEVSARFDIIGLDYEFNGLPNEVPEGRVAFRFTNESANSEPHEMVVLKRTPELTQSIDELAHMTPDQIMPNAQMVGVVFADQPGVASTSFLELDPGEYVVICTIPVGGGEEGDPHAAHGMIADLEVTAEES